MPEHWEEVNELFHAALECEPSTRSAFLARACAGDEALRREVESLIAAHERPGSFVDAPAFELAADLLRDDRSRPPVERQIGHYEVLDKLGAGGMAEVYLAWDSKLHRKVALKLLPPYFTRDEQRLGRFEREARAASALNHPNIITIHEIGEAGGEHFIAMEYVEGQTLRQLISGASGDRRIDGEDLRLSQILSIGEQIASALNAAHAAGIVHRDIKPENVMLRRDGYVKVLDFGLAKLTQTDSSLETRLKTSAGIVMGTISYMSPEQARGLRVDVRTDIWSLGAVLYEMIAGHPPFEGPTSSDVMAAILEHQPPALSVVRPQTPEALERIVTRALMKDRDDRYQAPREVQSDLRGLRQRLEDRERRFQSAQDVVFAPTEAPISCVMAKAMARGPARSKTALWIIAPCAVALIAVVAGILARRRAVSSESVTASIAVLPFANLSSEKDQDYFSEGLSEELAGQLAKVRQLRVAGRMSSFAFKGKAEDLAAIGQKLHVTVVLEGSVRRTGDHLRVSTQLVKVADGFQMWSETYDRKTNDVFAVQDEIASAVVAALKVKLLPSERPAISQSKTLIPEAYNQYLLGRKFFYLQGPDGYRRASAAFEKAIALDPGYAAAYAWLSRSLAQTLNFSTTAEENLELQRKAVWAADKAMELNPALAEGVAARGNVRTLITKDWAGAQADFARALLLDPSDTVTHNQYGRLLAKLARLPEAIVECRKASAIDPLFPGPLNLMGLYLYSSGQLAEARQVLTHALELSPDNEFGRFYLGVTLLLQGNPNDAIADLGPPKTAFRRTLLALAEHDLHRQEAAQRALDELIARDGQSQPYHVAEVYAWRGERDRAFEWLDRAFVQNDLRLSFVNTDPLVAKLRGDPRYGALLKKLSLPRGPK
jgi:serine/threonine protein kinase/TolB-like protein